MAENQSGNAISMLVISVILTVSLFYIPYGNTIGYPLLLLSTLAHEMGHGVASVLVGGNFEQFVLYQDASGVATSSWIGTPSRLQTACTSAGGLVGPAFVGMMLFIVGRNDKQNKGFLCLLGIGLILSVIFVVRNMFGMVFVGAVGVSTTIVGIYAKPRFAQLFSFFIGVQLALSVFSRGDYLFMEYAETTAGRMPSDVAKMSQALFLPYWVWGIFCGGLSILFLIVGLYVTFKSESSST